MQLRWYQQEAVQALFDYFNDPKRPQYPERSNPLICLPTGTGKSLVIAEFVRLVMTWHPYTRIMMSTHVKTLIKQNAAKLKQVWPTAPLGIYSAGLGKRENTAPIVFGGVQSMVKKFPMFGKRDLLIVDEAHLLAEEGSYLKLINELTTGPADTDQNSQNINPYLKVIGLTATPYRMGLGLMTNGKIFTDIVYDMCNIDGFDRLIADGHLCPLIPRSTRTTLDVSNVGMSKGEYNQGELQEAVDKQTITYAALQELVEYGQDRRSWLIFASGVEHANHICEMLNSMFGIPTVVIHSDNNEAENDRNLEAWKTGKVRAAVNMNQLTTGVDHPPCDLIGMLRPTMSTGLWVQMLGRGTRPYDYRTETDPVTKAAFPFVKENCLVLDFAGNTRRLGPINDPVIPKLKSEGPPGDAPVKICGACNTYNHASARVCIACGTTFTFAEKLSREASNLELLKSNMPQIETFTVKRVVLTGHESKKSGRNSIKVSYFCDPLKTFYEYISVQTNIPMFKHRSRNWFRQRYHYSTPSYTWESDCPETDAEVLALAGELRWPKKIKVWVNKQPQPEVMEYEF